MAELTERERMEAGLWYNAYYDQEILRERQRAMQLSFELSQTSPNDAEKIKKLLSDLFPNIHETVDIRLPVHCDYGYNIHAGKGTFFNLNCYLMDGAPITFGENVFIGPSCGFYTANHPFDFESRNQGLEKAQPIVVGDNVWFGGNVVVLPGVSIGAGSVIGSGSVVTKDVPAGVIAVGSPCKVLREITEADRVRPE